MRFIQLFDLKEFFEFLVFSIVTDGFITRWFGVQLFLKAINDTPAGLNNQTKFEFG